MPNEKAYTGVCLPNIIGAARDLQGLPRSKVMCQEKRTHKFLSSINCNYVSN